MCTRALPLLLAGACGFSANKGVGGSDAPLPDSTVSDAPAIDGPPTDGPPIDMPVDAAVALCMGGVPADTFQSNTPCSPWATSDSSGGAVTTQSGGKLRIAAPAAATGGSHGGCFAVGLSAFGPNGVFIEVEQAFAGINSYTAFTAYVATGTPASIRLQNGVIDLHNPSTQATAGTAMYDSTQMRYWRIRPTSNGVSGEVSPDLFTWQVLGTVTGAVPTMIRIDISAGTTGVTAAAGIAIFDNLNVCP